MMTRDAEMRDRIVEVPRIGFVCNWDPNPATTWSHTPWELRSALRSIADVRDLGVQIPTWERIAYKAAHVRRRHGAWTTEWKRSATFDFEVGMRVRGALRRNPCDVIVQIQDMCAPGAPYLILQDMSYDVLLDHHAMHGSLPHFPGLTTPMVERLRHRQLEMYSKSAGVLAMSEWFGRHLVEVSGVPAANVFVVHPGRTASAAPQPIRPRTRPRCRLLLVGKDFWTKGGDLVVAALALLRRDYSPEITLTVAGPTTWPLPGPVPDGLDFRGRLTATEVGELYGRHDLLVMPSRMEGFGIVFVEALANGLPVIARDAFAMPEIVARTQGGLLMSGEDPHTLAQLIVTALNDDDLYDRCAERAGSVAEYFSWRRAAADTLAAVTTVLAR